MASLTDMKEFHLTQVCMDYTGRRRADVDVCELAQSIWRQNLRKRESSLGTESDTVCFQLWSALWLFTAIVHFEIWCCPSGNSV